jgi:adhesin/invasin
VAPSGTTLAISANPARVSLTGTSTITVFGQKANGSVLDPGTIIRFSTDKGSIDPTGTIKDGQTTAIFRGDGSSGTATITATAGASTTATTKVQVGQSDVKPTVLLSVNPNNIPVSPKTGTKSTATITAIARNSDGTPVADGTPVTLTSTLGAISPVQPTTTNGVATATLTAGQQAGTSTITGIVGSSDAAMTMLTIRDAATSISLQVDRQSIQSGGDQTVNLTAFVFNAQQQPVQGATVIFSSTKPTLNPTTTTTNSAGQATSTLTIKAVDLANCEPITVTASTPSGTSTSFTDSKTITVTGCSGGG